MSVVALITWILTASGGIFLLAIWLIEYDHDFQRAAATRLPVPVISAHALLAMIGLVVWIGYLVADSDRLAWTAVAILLTGTTLGLIMAVRWISVYRDFAAARTGPGHGRPRLLSHAPQRLPPGPERALPQGPPERNFPLPVVIAHGVFAFVTVTLVLLTALGVGGS
jgi:hypothetical protein